MRQLIAGLMLLCSLFYLSGAALWLHVHVEHSHEHHHHDQHATCEHESEHIGLGFDSQHDDSHALGACRLCHVLTSLAAGVPTAIETSAQVDQAERIHVHDRDLIVAASLINDPIRGPPATHLSA